MKLTEQLKKWLREHCGVKADASDEEYRKAAGQALADGTLTTEEYTKLSTPPQAKEAGALNQKLDAVLDAVSGLVTTLTPKETKEETKTPESKETKEEETKEEETKEEKTPESKETKEEKKESPAWHKTMKRIMGTEVPLEVDGEVRVKGAWEAYDDTKSTATYPMATKRGDAHPLGGQPMRFYAGADSPPISNPSELDKAVCGAFSKLLAATAIRGSRSIAFSVLPQHDKELLLYSMENMKWGGFAGESDTVQRNLHPHEQKALIDDAVSGGLEAAPIVFDDQVIQTPLLHGELFPSVNVVPIDRGRRIEGVATGTVTASWGGVDDTAISLFNTASYVSAFDTTIYRWEGAIRIGLDFLSDTPIDFNMHISKQYGERLLEDLDDVIAVGNGTTQPEGVMNKSGTTSVAFGGSNSISSIESLRFGVAKAEHRSTVANSAVYCGTETTYSRWRALAVGGSDARRLFGMDHFGPNAGGYMIDGGKFAVNESMANTQAFYAILARYRMYRRRGLTMRTSTEGDTLIRNNEMLMAVTSRWGGQLERGACAAVSTTLPA